jgi:ketosteroid isomerase-like protein
LQLFLKAMCRRGGIGEPTKVSDDEAGILSAVDNYVSILNAADAQSRAGQWTDDADCTDPSGKIYKGREKIREALAA